MNFQLFFRTQSHYSHFKKPVKINGTILTVPHIHRISAVTLYGITGNLKIMLSETILLPSYILVPKSVVLVFQLDIYHKNIKQDGHRTSVGNITGLF